MATRKSRLDMDHGFLQFIATRSLKNKVYFEDKAKQKPSESGVNIKSTSMKNRRASMPIYRPPRQQTSSEKLDTHAVPQSSLSKEKLEKVNLKFSTSDICQSSANVDNHGDGNVQAKMKSEESAKPIFSTSRTKHATQPIYRPPRQQTHHEKSQNNHTQSQSSPIGPEVSKKCAFQTKGLKKALETVMHQDQPKKHQHMLTETVKLEPVSNVSTTDSKPPTRCRTDKVHIQFSDADHVTHSFDVYVTDDPVGVARDFVLKMNYPEEFVGPLANRIREECAKFFTK